MTDSAWKPVPHSDACKTSEWHSAPCGCSGTRWHGYGERVGDLAGVYALCQWFGMMQFCYDRSYSNQFTGSIPSLSANFRLTRVYYGTNQLTVLIPALPEDSGHE